MTLTFIVDVDLQYYPNGLNQTEQQRKTLNQHEIIIIIDKIKTAYSALEDLTFDHCIKNSWTWCAH